MAARCRTRNGRPGTGSWRSIPAMRANTRGKNKSRVVPALVLAVLLSSVPVWATQPPSADLKAKADAAQGSERIGPSLEYAHQELEYANTLYTNGDVEKGEAAVNESLTYAKR